MKKLQWDKEMKKGSRNYSLAQNSDFQSKLRMK